MSRIPKTGYYHQTMTAPVTDETGWGSGATGPGSARSSPFNEERAWASGMAARLKLVLGSFAEDEQEARRDYLAEELTRALKDVAPARRRSYLKALNRLFPSWEGAPGARKQDVVQDTPEMLVAKLVEVSPYLTVDQRKQFADQLLGAGIACVRVTSAAVPVAHAGVQEAVPVELQKKLGLSADQQLSQQRVLRLIAVLVDFTVTVDQVAWSMWRQIAPKSVIRREGGAEADYRKIAGPYLAGDDEVSTAQISQVLDKTRQLVAGILAGIGSTGEVFARQFLSKIAPPAIQEQADAESGFFLGPEQKCWRRYVNLFNEINGVAIEKEITSAIAKATEDLVLGADRSSSRDT